MISRRLTAVLLCGCIAIPGIMYFRDFGGSPPPPTAATAAYDAERVLGSVSPDCGSRCRVKVLGVAAPHRWRVQLSIGAWKRCYELDPTGFRFDTDRGFLGMSAASCRA